MGLELWLAASGLIGVGLALGVAWSVLGMGIATGGIAALVLLIISISFYVGTR